MAITFVGVGTNSENNNADGTPTLPTGWAAGDLLIVLAFLRGLNTDTNPSGLVGIGSGYTALKNFVHSADSPKPRLAVYYKIAGASESDPVVDITPMGASGNSVIAQVAAFRGVNQSTPIDVTGADSENASAQNIGAITGITATASDGAVIVVGGKCDDWNGGSVDLLTGDSLTWNEIGEPWTQLGQDAGIVWDYAIWSGSAPTVSNKTFTVTGGAANKGLGAMFSIKPAGGATRKFQRASVLGV
jgi:hypothetical protein